MYAHRIAIAANLIADAIINRTASVADTGPCTIIEGQDRNGRAFAVCTRPDGRMAVSFDEGGPTLEEMGAIPIPE